MSQMGGIDMLRDHLTGKKLRENRQKREKREQPKEKRTKKLNAPTRMFCDLN
jgi:hypothetical protein